MSHMFKGGLTPWKHNAVWRQQTREERLAEEARRKKREESGGGGDVVVKIFAALAGAAIVGTLFSGPGVPMN